MPNQIISIVLPIYNEQDAVIETIEKIKVVMNKTKYPFEIIAVNDCSKDSTKEKLKTINNITGINSITNCGYGASIKKGIKESIGDKILIIDADSTYPVESIPSLLEHINTYDMVVGSRTGTNVHIPFLRRPAKWFLNNFASYLANSKIPDLNSGLRIFNKDIALRFWNLFPERFSFTSTITMACLTNGYTVKYVPIDYAKRSGKSSISPIKDFIRFTSLLLRLTLYFRPLKVFVPCSLLMFIVGLTKGYIDFSRNGQVGSIAVTLTIAAIQIGFLGLIAEMINKK